MDIARVYLRAQSSRAHGQPAAPHHRRRQRGARGKPAHGRTRPALRHPGHLDAATHFACATAAFLDIPSIRLEFDGSESSQARERLFVALDVSLQHPA